MDMSIAKIGAMADLGPAPPKVNDARGPSYVAKQFETLLATQLVREMRGSLREGIFGSGPGSDAYSSWFDQHIADILATRGGLGVARMVEGSLTGPAATAEGEDA